MSQEADIIEKLFTQSNWNLISCWETLNWDNSRFNERNISILIGAFGGSKKRLLKGCESG